MKLEKAIEMFIEEMEIENKSKVTITNYVGDLRNFNAWCKVNTCDDVETLSVKHLKDYVKGFKECKATTINRKISSIKSLYKFMFENEIISENISLKLKAPKIEKTKPVIMSNDDAYDILKACEWSIEDGKNEERDYTILQLLFGTGIRREELTNIKLYDVDMKDKTILIHGKGNKEREVYMNDTVFMAIEHYVTMTRSKFVKAEISEYLFVSQMSMKLSLGTVNNIINKYMIMANCKVKGIGVHATRKKFASKAYNATGDIYAVAGILGHDSINTTQRYVSAEEGRKRIVVSAVNY